MNGIWIRSQDRETLAEARLITFEKEWCNDDGERCENAIITDISGTEYLLGEYPTRDRALQVLDEIQQFIVDCEHCKDNKMFYPVFQMDEE